jgi:transcriptional repressor NrdR
MNCPFCGAETKVTNKRDIDDSTKRRRECLGCGKRFTTYERLEVTNIVVVKKDGRRELFDIQKIRHGLMRACEKRPVSTQTIEAVIKDIENKLTNSYKKEVKSDAIGEIIMDELKKLDKVAYIRFASVYRDFKDLADFRKQLKGLK